MKSRPVHLHINTVSVGHKVPVGRESLKASIAQHLHQKVQHNLPNLESTDGAVHIPEVRIKAHPSASAHTLGELVANRISEHFQDSE